MRAAYIAVIRTHAAVALAPPGDGVSAVPSNSSFAKVGIARLCLGTASCSRCRAGIACCDEKGARIVADLRDIRRLSFACVAEDGPTFLRLRFVGTVSGLGLVFCVFGGVAL